jgi:FMN reductase
MSIIQGDPAPPRVLALSGNPRIGSRTLGAATLLAEKVAAALEVPDVSRIDLAVLAPALFAPSHREVDDALQTLAASTVAIVATPVYKASYTGLLKAFLDLYGPDGLAGVIAVPLIVSGNPAHALAGEVHLRPLLVELGAVVPTRSLAVVEGQLPDLPAVVDRFLEVAMPRLRSSVAQLVGASEGQ